MFKMTQSSWLLVIPVFSLLFLCYVLHS